MTRPANQRAIEDRLGKALADTALRTFPPETARPPFTPPADARSRRPRWLAPALAAAAVIVVVLLAIVLSSGTGWHQSQPVAPNPTGTNADSVTSAEPTPVPTSNQPSPTSTRVPPGDPTWQKLRNATFDVPSFGSLKASCPSGRRQFVNGTATASHIGGSPILYHLLIPPFPYPSRYGMPVYANIDGKPGDEVLVELSCEGGGSVHPEMLLALSAGRDGTFRTLGVLNRSGATFLDFNPATVRIANGTVVLDEMGEQVSNGGPLAMQQTRGYRYENGQFVQVSGPTRFPALPTNVHDIDPRNATWPLTGYPCTDSCGTVYANFINGHGRATDVMQRPNGTFDVTTYDYTMDQSSYMTFTGRQPDLALLTITRTAPDGSTTQALYAAYASMSGAWPILWTGADGVQGIASASGRDGVATVVVHTASGDQTRTYKWQGDPQSWTRTS